MLRKNSHTPRVYSYQFLELLLLGWYNLLQGLFQSLESGVRANWTVNLDRRVVTFVEARRLELTDRLLEREVERESFERERESIVVPRNEERGSS